VSYRKEVTLAVTKGCGSPEQRPILESNGEKANPVDVLFVDEAGQTSLANVIAVFQAPQASWV
jgi:hypothetical protein